MQIYVFDTDHLSLYGRANPFLIAIAHEGILLTRNRKDFEKVPNLMIADWTL